MKWKCVPRISIIIGGMFLISFPTSGSRNGTHTACSYIRTHHDYDEQFYTRMIPCPLEPMVQHPQLIGWIALTSWMVATQLMVVEKVKRKFSSYCSKSFENSRPTQSSLCEKLVHNFGWGLTLQPAPFTVDVPYHIFRLKCSRAVIIIFFYICPNHKNPKKWQL